MFDPNWLTKPSFRTSRIFLASKNVWITTLFGLLIFLTPAITHAEWAEDGIPAAIPDIYYDREDHTAVSDDSGGAFMAWVDDVNYNNHITIQHTNEYGDALWGDQGIDINVDGFMKKPALCPDGAGGAIMVYLEDWVPMARRLNGNGVNIWNSSGVVLGVGGGSIQVVSDGLGGAIVAWHMYGGMNPEVYCQRVDPTGQILWGSSGLLVSGSDTNNTPPAICSDGAGGAWVSWSHDAIDGGRCTVARIEPDGTISWTTDVASGLYIGVSESRLLPAEHRGVYVVWENYGDDGVLVGFLIKGQSLDSDGSALWAVGGELISNAGVEVTESSLQVASTADGGYGGYFITWREHDEIYARRVLPAGPAANPVSHRVDFGDVIRNPVIVPDQQDGAFIAWACDQGYESGWDIYLQQVDRFGYASPEAYTPFCQASGDQDLPILMSDGNRGCIAAWRDRRAINGNGAYFDLYFQRIQKDLYWGYPYPSLVSVTDVPGDQGGMVFLAWDRSRLDTWEHNLITDYSVWRSIESGMANKIEGEGIRREMMGDKTLYWQEVGQVTARELEGYSFAVPTLFDSTSTHFDPHFFQVMANTADPLVFWVSRTDSAYSVDNLAPGVPVGLVASYNAGDVVLDWDDAPEDDFLYHHVYRGTDAGFIPAPGNLVQETTASNWTDPASNPWGYFYKVTTLDLAGNESEAAEPMSVSGVGANVVPTITALLSAYPNPFNPSTKLSFELATPARVRLNIFDAAGRLVTTLVDEQRGVGRHEFVWNGQNDAGRSVASGVYLYRFETGDVMQTKRMMLLK